MRKISTLLIILLIGFALFPACQQARRPEGQAAPAEEMKEEPTISLYVAETGEKKELKMEEYLKGVVAAEMEPTWPLEALAAQAILARTFTLEKIEDGGVEARGTDASTDIEEFQAYNESRINDNVVKAVERTRGEVALHKGEYIKAWFFADAGGKTAASAMEGLAYDKEPTPYIHSVDDPGAAITAPENKSWTASFPLETVRQKLQEATGQNPGAISSATIEEKGPSGRITKVKVGSLTTSGPALRLALGSEEMRSTLVSSLSVQGNKLVIQGKGFGHGVGMSQWGANAMAEQGKKAEEIIQYFFKDVEIKQEWK